MDENLMGRGMLAVRVTAGLGTLPIEGAVVHIKPYSDTSNEGDVLFTLRTDSSGLTDRIMLQTPLRELSLSPGADILPYAEYNITVFKDGYRTSENIGVPVFDGIESVQTVNLLPLTDGGDESLNAETVYYENYGYESLNGSLNGGTR